MSNDKPSLEERIRALWSAANQRSDITSRSPLTPQLQALMDRHIALCVQDVVDILRESTIEFYVQYQDLKLRGMDDLTAHSRIFNRNNFPYADALYDLRGTEALTGRRHSLDIKNYFPLSRFTALVSDSFQNKIPTFMEEREWQKANATSDFAHFKRIHQPRTETPEEYTAQSTHQIVSVLRNYHKPNSSGFLKSNACQMAVMLAQTPDKIASIEDGLQSRAEDFVRSLPYIQNPQLFIAKINERAKSQERSHNVTVVPLFGKAPE